MKSRKRHAITLISFLSALGLCQLISADLLATASETQSDSLVRRPVMRLIGTESGGGYFTVEKIPQVNGRLITVGGQPLRGKSRSEIESMLVGPIGSTIDFSFLGWADDSFGAAVVKREPFIKGGTPTISSNVRNDYIHSLEKRDNDFPMGYAIEAESCPEQNLDLLARALSHQVAEALEWIPEPKSSLITQQYIPLIFTATQSAISP